MICVADKKGIKTIAANRKARHDYYVLETYEAGVELFGTEVKSIRAGAVSLKESWCEIRDGEIYVVGMNVSAYEKGNIFNREPLRDRRLLMHKSEIAKLYADVKQKGLTIIPLSVYLKDSKVKLELGLCKGKKLYDKREAMAERDASREIDRAMKQK